ncbi:MULTISPECIES: hypothetical protein [unclassified Sinorhizobium]|uniref:hypothetical protein n=1 Tax=unclassified Sinorhizobium TaxID=2613772 RepID=UPI003523EECD
MIRRKGSLALTPLSHQKAGSLQEFHRPRSQTVKGLVNLVIMAAFAVWNIRDGLEGSTSWLIIGCIFALWAVFIALNLIRRRIPVIVNETGLVVNRIIRSPVQIQWPQMEAAKLPETASPVLIGWRASPGAKLQYTGVSQRVLGEVGAKALRSSILAARPDLDGERLDEQHEGSA